jgi:hypothetical protein
MYSLVNHSHQDRDGFFGAYQSRTGLYGVAVDGVSLRDILDDAQKCIPYWVEGGVQDMIKTLSFPGMVVTALRCDGGQVSPFCIRAVVEEQPVFMHSVDFFQLDAEERLGIMFVPLLHIPGQAVYCTLQEGEICIHASKFAQVFFVGFFVGFFIV